MGRGRLYFTLITVLIFGAFSLLGHFATSKEFHREVACYRDVVRLNCGNHSFIAIHEAYYTGAQEENLTCTFPVLEHEYIEDESATEPANQSGCYEDIRVYVNRKCSGSKECRYSYEDEPEKICPNLGGVFVVRYDCVKDSSLINYCNEKVNSREGYIASPGFPRYCPQMDDCSWTLDASEGQTILAKVLHLHVRPATEVHPTVADSDLYAMGILGQLMTDHVTRCDDDALTLLEGNIKRAVVCGEDVQSLKTIEADASNGLQIKFRSGAFLPTSGFLMYFKIEGCPTLAAPKGSYLLERNGSAAVYACSNNQVFNDTQESTRFLSCVRDHHWNDTLPPCTPLEETTTIIMTTTNKSTESETEMNVTIANTEQPTATQIFQKDAAYLEDILIPCILIGVLVVGNAIIVAIIIAIRRKQKAKMKEEDENLSQPKSQPLVAEIKDV